MGRVSAKVLELPATNCRSVCIWRIVLSKVVVEIFFRGLWSSWFWIWDTHGVDAVVAGE